MTSPHYYDWLSTWSAAAQHQQQQQSSEIYPAAFRYPYYSPSQQEFYSPFTAATAVQQQCLGGGLLRYVMLCTH